MIIKDKHNQKTTFSRHIIVNSIYDYAIQNGNVKKEISTLEKWAEFRITNNMVKILKMTFIYILTMKINTQMYLSAL